jgi:hypothetical protein
MEEQLNEKEKNESLQELIQTVKIDKLRSKKIELKYEDI